MNSRQPTYRLLMLVAMIVVGVSGVSAQDTIQSPVPKAQLRRLQTVAEVADSLPADSLTVSATDGEPYVETTDTLPATSLVIKLPAPQDAAQLVEKKSFIPDPKKALWLSVAFPGAGQIYNRKYWKLPIIYGGFLGCVYALNWNNMMYRDYSQAYIDIMDSDPNTVSYENFIPRGYDINRNLSRIQDLFRRKKNYYRRYRDLSLFVMIGVYALSVIDAYVDAEMSSFDISPDLSMKVRPSVIRDTKDVALRSPYTSQSYGIRCSIEF